MPSLSTFSYITILLDNGYHPETLTAAMLELYPQIMTKIRFELAPKQTLAEKAAEGKMGFVVVATRWVIERSNAWMERCKSLVKNFERTLSHATAFAQSLLHQTDAQKIGI